MSARTPVAYLRDYVYDAGSQAAAARKLGVTRQYICMVLAGDRPVGARILAKLGLKRIIVKR